MRIGITCYPTYGGSGILATELGKLLALRGHEVHFISSALPYRLQPRYRERLYFHEVEMSRYPLFEHSPYDLALAAKMREIYLQEKLDLLHVHYALPHAVSAFLASRMVAPRRIPVVTTLHGTDITIVGKEKSFFEITRLGINESCVVTAVSKYLENQTNRVFYPDKPIRHIYNFVDFNLFRPGPIPCDRSHFAKADQVIYFHLSNFRPVKRIPDVINTFAETIKEVDGVLLLAGEGPASSQAREMVRDLGIQDRVSFLGKQEDIVTFLNLADVFLFPSEVESFGLATLEAMACEKPVVASRSGGIPEVVEHEVTGFLADVGDLKSLVEASVVLGKSESLRHKMGTAGRRRGMEKFHPDIILPQYEAAYREAVECCRTAVQEAAL